MKRARCEVVTCLLRTSSLMGSVSLILGHNVHTPFFFRVCRIKYRRAVCTNLLASKFLWHLKDFISQNMHELNVRLL